MATAGGQVMVTLEMIRGRGVNEMATTSLLVRVTGEVPLTELRAMPQVVEIVRVEQPPSREERLARQREIIHARRGELRRFLRPR